MKNEQEGFPITALREIKIMMLLDHVRCSVLASLKCSPPPLRPPPRGRGRVFVDETLPPTS